MMREAAKEVTVPNRRLVPVMAAALLCFALPAGSQELPEGKGKELVAAHCNSCHPFYARLGAGYTPGGWVTVMRMMANHGVTLPTDQVATITEYLTKNFPEKAKPAGVVIPGPAKVSIKEWPVPTPGSRPHDPKTGEIKLLTPPTPKSRPYGMAVNSKGTVFYVAFGTNKVGSVDPKTLEIREYPLPDAASRPRRVTITSDDLVWYSDFSRGYLGRLDPATGKVSEWPSPSGPKSEPYGISAINNAIWYSESGTTPNTVVRFDPKAQKFQSWAIPGGGNIVRNTSVTRGGDFVLANSLVNAVTLVRIAK